MLLQKFFERISNVIPETVLLGDLRALSHLNPDKFYLENVRSVLGVSSAAAQRICDTAVRRRAFLQFVEVTSPEGVGVAFAPTETELPLEVHYWTEQNGEHVETFVPTADLRKTVFYRLNDAPSIADRQTA